MSRKACMIYLPDCKFIFKGTSPYGDIIFVNKTSVVMNLYALLHIKNLFILSYTDDKYRWIPIYIYNKKSLTFTCQKNARFYYDASTKEITILNNKFHSLDTLITNSSIPDFIYSENQIHRLIYFYYYSYVYFDIRYSYTKENPYAKVRHCKSLELINDFINDVKLRNRFSLKLFVNKMHIDIYKHLEVYKDFCNNGINHDILLKHIFDSLLFLNINYNLKYEYDSIIYKQLFGIGYKSNFKHFNVFTLNDKNKTYKYYKVSVKDKSQLTNLVVYTNNYLLRLIDVRE